MNSAGRPRCNTVPTMSRCRLGEVFAGIIELVRPSKNGPENQRMFVNVYKSPIEHYAVLIPVITDDPPIAINLRRCIVKAVQDSVTELHVSPRSGEGQTLTFRISPSNKKLYNEWIDALTSIYPIGSCSRRTLKSKSTLPVLQESDEESEVTNK